MNTMQKKMKESKKYRKNDKKRDKNDYSTDAYQISIFFATLQYICSSSFIIPSPTQLTYCIAYSVHNTLCVHHTASHLNLHVNH